MISSLAGGNFDDSVGYFIEPTVVETSSKTDKIFFEELFGPVVTAYVYKDSEAKDIVNHIGTDTPYALTGALYSQDQWVKFLSTEFKNIPYAFCSGSKRKERKNINEIFIISNIGWP